MKESLSQTIKERGKITLYTKHVILGSLV